MTFRITRNQNQPEETSTLFLEHKGGVLGSAEYRDGKWLVSIADIYDPKTDTDCQVIGSYEDKTHALSVLWNKRHLALALATVTVNE